MGKFTVFIGIDPGKKGAISVLTNEMSKIDVPIWDMPCLPNGEIDTLMIYSYLAVFDKYSTFVVLEKAQAMPKQGVKSIFTYAQGYGKIKGLLEFLSFSYEEVRPLKWKKEFSLGKDKKDSVTTAIKLFPDIKSQFYGKRGGIKDGRAESLLMAEYARRKYPEIIEIRRNLC